MTVPVTIRIQSADFDIAAEIAALTKGNTDIGAGSVGSQASAEVARARTPSPR